MLEIGIAVIKKPEVEKQKTLKKDYATKERFTQAKVNRFIEINCEREAIY